VVRAIAPAAPPTAITAGRAALAALQLGAKLSESRRTVSAMGAAKMLRVVDAGVPAGPRPATDTPSTDEWRVCKDCGESKLASEFYKPRPDNMRRTCKRCQNERRVANRRANPEAASATARRSKLRRVYGISPEEYDAILVAQRGVCAICARPNDDGRRLHVDHCHDSGKVRGLLCHLCNRALGAFGDDPDRVERAVEYLRR
jgi:hypothetical protein